MNPLHLHARNYRCFDTLDLQLPDGCVAILGQNGAGKSSIVNAIDVAVFGPESRSLADLLSDTCVDEELLLELEFEHAGALYRVRRTFSARGRGKTTLDFERRLVYHADEGTSGYDWSPLTHASAKDTQELIEATIGLSRETFRASAFLAQGDGAAFTGAQPRDRKRILAEVLGLDRYDRLQKLARADKQRLQDQHLELTGRMRAAEELVAQKPAVVRERDAVVATEIEVVDALADLERDHATLAERYQAAREQQARRQAAEAELREAATALERLQQRNAAADEAARAITAASLELDQLPAAGDTVALERREADLAAAVEEHSRLVRERDTAALDALRLEAQRTQLLNAADSERTRANTIRAAIADLEATPYGEAKCDRCQQVLAGNSRALAVESMAKDANVHLSEEARLRDEATAVVIPTVPVEPTAAPLAELDQVRAQLRTIRDTATRRAQLEERIRQNEAAAAAGPQPDELTASIHLHAAKQRALADLQPVDVDDITRQGTLVKQRLETTRGTLEQQRLLRARLDERLAQIQAAETELVNASVTRQHLQEQVDVVVELERAFGPSGIPTLIVENAAIPYLETEANRILVELGTSYRVELRTQADLKSGDGLRETLDVIVTTEAGMRAYETFSGGERTRINLALRIALARLLAHRRGAESRLLAIDEPEFLDETGTAALVDVLRGLQDDFDKLYIVSHVPGLRDSFDTTVTVADGQIVDTVSEAVPA